MVIMMNDVIVKTFDNGIEFHKNGVCFYDICNWQLDSEIKTQEWLRHLSDKNWFTCDVSHQFLDYCESLQVSK